jgi:hypothetical protein
MLFFVFAARGLRSAAASIGGRQLVVATTHLESPIPPQVRRIVRNLEYDMILHST